MNQNAKHTIRKHLILLTNNGEIQTKVIGETASAVDIC